MDFILATDCRSVAHRASMKVSDVVTTGMNRKDSLERLKRTALIGVLSPKQDVDAEIFCVGDVNTLAMAGHDPYAGSAIMALVSFLGTNILPGPVDFHILIAIRKLRWTTAGLGPIA